MRAVIWAEGWHNPIYKDKPPKVPLEPLEAISLEDISKILKFCGVKDKAILLVLLDTGVRAMELLDMNAGDVSSIGGEILVRSGKGRKPRTVYLGAKSRKAVRAYLKNRQDINPAIWVPAPERDLPI